MQGEAGATEQVFSAQRRAMVDGQIRTFDVTDARVIRAFDLTPRELFLPPELRALSYSDALLTLRSSETGRPLRTLMQPMHLARLLQSVDPAPDARVLVVAGGAGYAAALLLEMVAEVVTLESDAGLSALAAEALVRLGGRAEAVTGPLAAGWTARAPYDAVLVLGGVEANLEEDRLPGVEPGHRPARGGGHVDGAQRPAGRARDGLRPGGRRGERAGRLRRDPARAARIRRRRRLRVLTGRRADDRVQPVAFLRQTP